MVTTVNAPDSSAVDADGPVAFDRDGWDCTRSGPVRVGHGWWCAAGTGLRAVRWAGRDRRFVGDNDYATGGLSGCMTEYTTFSIPTDLADRVEDTIEGTSFSSTSDLVRFLLRSIVIQHQQAGGLTESEFEEIASQLRDLGYLE